ncbi:MAG TPA: sulfurtransferase TusA family protein [Syntrophales bacterium]|jgi:TusA-related sulfurtransferase|nr:sulfurtransferase TusA family protein [Syntrophales bacterium]HON22667.1 sulfurtransferase TusA family protein [Syntrophales bacterium]HOU78503.1 sulfurtransferase TusA family protein [Syntrophales bacterium]HPC33540.1 sulfurtransferase TusA family protein [Syntrophales bacterium]HQG35261.1 sulfurtransferase TusA family protein [Syntrophales bacterium]
MAKTVDARGLSCPQPVLMTLDEIKAGTETELLVLVDNDASKENVSRAVQSRKWRVESIEEKDGTYQIAVKKG